MSLSVPHGVAIGAAPLQEWLSLAAKDAAFSAMWLSRDEFGITFLHQLGLMDLCDSLEPSKGLSEIFECLAVA